MVLSLWSLEVLNVVLWRGKRVFLTPNESHDRIGSTGQETRTLAYRITQSHTNLRLFRTFTF